MPIELFVTPSAQEQLSCCKGGCRKHITSQASLDATGEELVLRFVCESGHMNAITLALIQRISEPPLSVVESQARETLRAKISGVTFANSDGTSRQNLLPYVKPGDDLLITEGDIDGRKAYIVKHPIGILGTVKKDVIRQFAGNHPSLPIAAKVVMVTGGTGEKGTYGCNIELRADKHEVLLLPQPALEKRTAADPRLPTRVFIDRDGRNIYHMDKHCSGLKCSEEVSLSLAKNVLLARPCKKCATGLTARM